MSALSNELSTFESVAERVLTLFAECTTDTMLGRKRDIQQSRRIQLGRRNEALRLTFPELLKKFDLERLWEERDYAVSVYGLSACLTDALSAAALQVMAYTGMRHNEVVNLPFYCLDEVKRQGKTHFIVKGTVTKLTIGINVPNGSPAKAELPRFA